MSPPAGIAGDVTRSYRGSYSQVRRLLLSVPNTMKSTKLDQGKELLLTTVLTENI